MQLQEGKWEFKQVGLSADLHFIIKALALADGGGGRDCLETATTGGILCLQNKIGVGLIHMFPRMFYSGHVY